MFNEIRGLSQAVIQNGGTLYDVIELYSTKSIRQMKKVFKTLRDKQEEMQERQQQLQEQQQKAQEQQQQQQLQQAQEEHQADLAHEDYQNDLDRINKKEIAVIAAEAKGPLPDENRDNIPDALQISQFAHEQTKAARDYQLRMAEIASKANESQNKNAIEREKLKVEREDHKNNITIAKINASNRGSKKKK